MRMILVSVILLIGCGSDTAVAPTRDARLQPLAGASFCPEVDVSVSACTNHQGSFITLSGAVSFDGLIGKFILRNNAKGTHERKEVVFELVLVKAGEIVFDKQPVLGGVGGNPHIAFQLCDGDGNPIGGEIDLGRCVQR